MAQMLSEKRRSVFKFGFFTKVTVHIILMTLFTGIVITAVTAYQFQREIYRLEYNSALTVYASLVNYLAEHYRAHGQYIPPRIDAALHEKFLYSEDTGAHIISHRPSRMVLYRDDGHVLYEYRDDDPDQRTPAMDPDDLPSSIVQFHDQNAHIIHISGPISRLDEAPGFVFIQFPTQVQDQIGNLLVRSFTIMLGVLAATMLLSALFTRQVLSPIKALTYASRAIHQGRLEQEVPVVSDDEVGELTHTFNDMSRSMARRMDFMHRMQEWTVRIGRQLDSQRLFEILGEMFERMSSADSYRLYLKDALTDRMDVRLEFGAERLPPPDDDRLARMAIKERWTMYLMEDGTSDSEPGDVVELAIPLLSGKQSIGVIRIGRKSDRSLYDDDTMTILQTLAQHASVAIDNASLYERLSAQERMAQEMLLAREIQRSMLPREAPILDGYEIVGGSAPALEVGGDYYDYVRNNGSCYLMIGDVSGKGVPAALIMSIVRALIHTYLEFETSPREVLSKVNRNISNDLDPEMFVTMTTVQLQMETHELHFARAGHEPLMILNAQGEVRNISPRGAALGMLEVEDFEEMLEEKSCTMELGDTVLLYTDGITEAQNADHEEFGYDRLDALVRQNYREPVRKLYESIIDAIHAFTVGVPQNDDITLVIVRRTK